MSNRDMALESLSGIGKKRADALRSAGFETVDALRHTSSDELTNVSGISRRLADQILAEVNAESDDIDETLSRVGNERTSITTESLDHLSSENKILLDISRRRELLRRTRPELLIPVLLRPCQIDILLVADGGLYFNEDDFGLEAFIETLLSPPGAYVRFNLTLAHRQGWVTDHQMLSGNSRIVRRIKGFRFDNSDHFTTDRYDQVWLFGIEASGSPTNAELRVISEFMDGGGGVFATGDHGALGKALCGSIPRVRSMRLWDDSSGRVGMTDSDRNDTNRAGRDTSSEFNDQSDDIPQPIQPKLYHQRQGIWRVSYPHPLLCGPKGAIRIMPDHPHEGECIEPTDTDRQDTYDGYTITEYPANAGSPRPLPKVIATSSVPAGNKAADRGFEKAPTDPHAFGGISVYDGHYANVGRVVTDATWHHFININLIGDDIVQRTDPTNHKAQGFLSSPQGQAYLEGIKTYFRNIAVWIARPSQIHCMNTHLIWNLLWHHRVIEAVSTRPDVNFELADAGYILDVGKHARDVLGRYASQCQSRRLAIDILRPKIDEKLLERLDPWWPKPKPIPDPRPGPDPVPWVTPEPLLELALGGALIALREEFPEPNPEIREEAEEIIDEVIERGVEKALEVATESIDNSLEEFASLWD